jgi:cytochrome c peroxidase
MIENNTEFLYQLKMMKKYQIALILSGFLMLLLSCKTSQDDINLQKKASGVFAPLPDNFFKEGTKPSAELIELGHNLFFEISVSSDGKTSCSTCHPPEKFGADRLSLSIGNHSKVNPRNAPTILNVVPQFAQHWRADRIDVEDQALQALTGPASFGAPDRAFVEDILKKSPFYSKAFALAFPDEPSPVTAENFAIAVGAYERTLVSRSQFDDYLKGNTKALSEKEKDGLRLFMDKGCIGCHSGPLLGGMSMQKFGITEPYPDVLYSKDKTNKTVQPDQGRKAVTKKDEDLHYFKVPGLRNVSETYPYFHDGSVNSLNDAVHIMGRLQLGIDLTPEETESIVNFLKSLKGNIPPNFSAPKRN